MESAFFLNYFEKLRIHTYGDGNRTRDNQAACQAVAAVGSFKGERLFSKKHFALVHKRLMLLYLYETLTLFSTE